MSSPTIGASPAATYLRSDATGAPDASGATAPASGSGSIGAALYQAFGATAFPTGPFGTRSPQNAEDAAILLAEAALAIDAANDAARNNRYVATAGSARGSAGAAVSDLVVSERSLSGAQATKAQYETQLSAVQRQIGDLEGQIAGAGARIAVLDAEIALARLAGDGPKAARLSTERDGVAASRDAAVAQRDDLAAEAGRLAGGIAEQAGLIVLFTGAVQAKGFAVVVAFAEVARAVQDTGSARAQETARSTEIDRRLDEVGDLVRSFATKEVERAEADARHTQERRDESVANRVQALALGLVAGLADVLDALRRVETAPALNAREAAITAGQRFQLSL